MLKSHIFPYGITLKESGKIDVFPAAQIGFYTSKGEWLSLFLIIDSGAAISALPKSDAEMFDMALEKGAPVVIGGVGGEAIKGWRHEVMVRLEDEVIKIPIVFLDSVDAPRILGREGVFEHFSIIFEESGRRTGFLAEGSREMRAVQQILKRIEK